MLHLYWYKATQCKHVLNCCFSPYMLLFDMTFA